MSRSDTSASTMTDVCLLAQSSGCAHVCYLPYGWRIKQCGMCSFTAPSRKLFTIVPWISRGLDHKKIAPLAIRHWKPLTFTYKITAYLTRINSLLSRYSSRSTNKRSTSMWQLEEQAAQNERQILGMFIDLSRYLWYMRNAHIDSMHHYHLQNSNRASKNASPSNPSTRRRQR